jgi:uncharacterized protein YacL
MNMNTEQLLIVAVLLVLLAEVTYIVAKLPRQSNGKKKYIFVDTSVLIDGRIISIASSGFIGDTLAIPRSVIGELQFLADNADTEKRARARHGLDIARELQELEGVNVELFQDGSKAEEGVDERLLNLAKKHGGAICTIDYNLNKVAAVEGIKVCNVNELAKTLRMAYLPGERMLLELVQKGQDSHQAVGYLKDGTMVVVEQSSSMIGKTVEVEFIRSLQTAAGKMMFARRVEQTQKPKAPQPLQKATGTKPVQTVQPVKKAVVATPKPQQDPQPRRTRKPQSQPQQRQQAPRQAKRPARSSDREAALIELVDKQS